MRRLRSNPVVAAIMRGAKRLVMPVLVGLNRVLRRLSGFTHRAQDVAEGALGGGPGWYDHQIDINWRWPRTGRWEFLARGVLSGLAIREGARVLDLCSGDGFFAARFYAIRAGEVVGVDLDRRAVAHASKVNSADNLSYQYGDMRFDLPDGPFDNVIWDGGVTFLTPEEFTSTLEAIRARLGPGGVLSGYTDQEPSKEPGEVRNFADGEDVARALNVVFPHVCVLDFPAGTRQVFQFFASEDESAIPIAGTHPGVVWLGESQ